MVGAAPPNAMSSIRFSADGRSYVPVGGAFGRFPVVEEKVLFGVKT